MVAAFPRKTRLETQNACRAAAADPLVFKLAGLAFVSLLPATFWVGVFRLLAPAAGVAVTMPALVFAGSAISVFLATVCGPIMLRAPA